MVLMLLLLKLLLVPQLLLLLLFTFLLVSFHLLLLLLAHDKFPRRVVKLNTRRCERARIELADLSLSLTLSIMNPQHRHVSFSVQFLVR